MPLQFDNDGLPQNLPMVEIVRELTDDDIQIISGAPLGWKRSPLQKITIAHHTIARMCAENVSIIDISAASGRTPASIQQLRADPAFKELVAHYQKVNNIAKIDLEEQLRDLASASISVMQERLELEPEKVSDADLRKNAQLGLDRIGHGPTRTVKVNNAAEVIKELVEARKARQAGRVIDITPGKSNVNSL